LLVSSRRPVTTSYAVGADVGDGAAALELARNHPDPIQLLMTDILMPKMGGIELAEQLSKLRPDLEVRYTSG